MLESYTAFAEDLRTAGVPISTSELLDATAVLAEVGDRRSACKAGLRAALVKRAEHIRTFDSLFDAHFGSGQPPTEVGNLSEEDLYEMISIALEEEEDDDALVAAVRAAIVRFGGLVPGRFLGIDYHARRVMRHLAPIDAIAIGEEADWLEVFDAQHKLRRLETAVDNELQAKIVEQRGTEWAVREARDRAPEHLDFLHFSANDVADLHRVVDQMGRKLAARLRRRRRAHSRGRLNARATVRRSLASGGVPFEPIFRRSRPHRPDLVVLADVSGSVATFARFTLQLVQALSGQFGQLRTFAFVDEVDEVTQWFHHGNDFETAMTLLNSRARTIGDEGHSDYGRVFDRFEQRWGREIRPTTTVIVLGDARNNYHPVHEGSFAAAARRARKVYWLNPEPQSYWDTADSVISSYSQHCDGVFECRNLTQLSNAIAALS